MRAALFLPPFGELADPRALAAIARDAEESGWDGCFLWDHVLRPGPPTPVADPWIALAAMAVATERIRLGPLVTPVVRRRPHKLAREIITLDHLSGGRLTVGLGLGVDTGRELSAFGEVVDARTRGEMLDEGLDLLTDLLSGGEVRHRGRYFVADGVTLLPRPVQRPRPPMWMAARTTNPAPLRRAARADGLVPIEVNPDQVTSMLEVVSELRGGLGGFDVAVIADDDARRWCEVGATWWLVSRQPGVGLDEVRRLAAGAPPELPAV